MKSFSLKTKMALTISAVFVISVAFLTFFIMSNLEREYKRSLTDQQFTLVSSLVKSVDDKLSLIQNALIAGAARVPKQALHDSVQAQNYLDSKTGLLSIFDNGLFLLSQDGKLIAESPFLPKRRGKDLSFREYYQKAITSKGPYISTPYISTHTPGAQAIMVTAPVFDREGRVLAILGGSFNLMGNNLFSNLAKINIGRTGYVFLVASDKTIILHPEQQYMTNNSNVILSINKLLDGALAGIAASGETITADGLPVIASYKRLQSTDWLLGVHYPLLEAYAPFNMIKRYVILAILAGTILVLIMVWTMMRWFLQPLTIIARHMEESPSKPREQNLLPVTSGDEMGMLASAFNFMMIEMDGQKEKHDKLQAQLQQVQKMESIGRFAGNIAHDFNNMLTAIIGFGTLLRMDLNHDEKLRGYVEQMLSASDKAANLSRGLLAFSRKQVMDQRPVDISAIINNMKTILSRVISEDIEFKTILKDEQLIVMADSGQIEQILLNLVTNARDAMPEGGHLTIETSLTEMDDEYIRVHGFGEPGKYALVSVTDTGYGMDESTRQKIFEPFFTTKEVGKGTGLGLSIAYGIVKQHNGFITAYSEEKQGTTFRMYLPLIKAEISRVETKIAPVLKRGNETILVIEDNDQVRQFSRTALENFGYKVIEAVDGTDALFKFEEHKNDIDLLLLDVIMPKRNGREVYDDIRRLKPDMKVIFCSGYTGEVLANKGVLKKEMNFLSKPLSSNELLRKVREVLDN